MTGNFNMTGTNDLEKAPVWLSQKKIMPLLNKNHNPVIWAWSVSNIKIHIGYTVHNCYSKISKCFPKIF